MAEELIKAISTDGEEIRKFSNEKIQSYVTDALKSLPEGKKIAVIGLVTTEGKYELSAVYRIGDEWSVVASGFKESGKKFTGQAAVVWSK